MVQLINEMHFNILSAPQLPLPRFESLVEIDHSRLDPSGLLRKGHFSDVHKGTLDKLIPVAVKFLIPGLYKYLSPT